MKIFGLFLAIFACMSFQQAEAFIDLVKYCINVNSARYKDIDSIITKTLATKDMKWQEIRTPYPDKHESWSAYAPVYESRNNPKTVFQFVEYHHADHPTLRSAEDIFQHEKAIENRSGKRGTRTIEDEKIVENETVYKCILLCRDETTICFEIEEYNHQKTYSKIKQKKEMFSDTSEEKETGDLENEEKKLKEYKIFWLVDLGNGEFRQYSLAMVYKPSDNEKQNILNRFFSMEEQIRNVRT